MISLIPAAACKAEAKGRLIRTIGNMMHNTYTDIQYVGAGLFSSKET